jgi:transposase
MTIFIIKATQTNFMQIEIEAETEDEALEIYASEENIEDDFTRISGEWDFTSITEKESN